MKVFSIGLSFFCLTIISERSVGWPAAFNGIEPDSKWGLALNNIGYFEGKESVIYNCVRVLMNGKETTSKPNKIDLALDLLSIEDPKFRIVDSRVFNPSNLLHSSGVSPDCSGEFETLNNVLSDFVMVGNALYEMHFLLTDLDSLEFTLSAYAKRNPGYPLFENEALYPDFKRYIEVKGLRIFARDLVSVEFLQKVGDVYSLMLLPAVSIEDPMQIEFINRMELNQVHQRVGYIDFEQYGNVNKDAIPGYGDNLTDYIWEPQKNSKRTSRILGEVLEHLLHTITNVALPLYFKDSWNWLDPNAKINLALNEAIEKGYFNISDFQNLKNNGDLEGYTKALTTEFAYWLILAEWDYFSLAGKVEEGYGTGNSEFALGTALEVSELLPIAHSLYTETVLKVLSKPDERVLEGLFFNIPTCSTSDEQNVAPADRPCF
ncbi:hypothetical protein N9478_03535 [Gammaproteobacteria bacterium]|nr:hypothetical protein [Gammaproteobacteria bacterium]